DRKQAAQKCGIHPGTCLWIVGINQQVFLIVDVTLKILLGEMVESRCEDELAHGASVVIDGYAGTIENPAPVNLAVLVEIDDAVEVSHSTTAFARRFVRANGLQSRVHQASPSDTAQRCAQVGHGSCCRSSLVMT